MPDTQPKAPDDPAGGVGAGGTGATADKSPPPVIAGRPGGTATSPGPAQRNPIFAELVQGEEDLPGLVGYALYKQNKRDWLTSFFKAHGREPTEDEIESYILGERTQRRLATYRRLADELIGRKTATPEKNPEVAAAVAASPQRVTAVKGDSLRSSLPGEAQSSATAKAAAKNAGKSRRSGAATLIFWILVLLVLAGAALLYFDYPSLLHR